MVVRTVEEGSVVVRSVGVVFPVVTLSDPTSLRAGRPCRHPEPCLCHRTRLELDPETEDPMTTLRDSDSGHLRGVWRGERGSWVPVKILTGPLTVYVPFTGGHTPSTEDVKTNPPVLPP